MILSVRNKREISSAVRKILDHAPGGRIFAFYGTLGAGKTTIIKVFCDMLGAADIVSSPTFTIVNEYRTAGGEPLYHIDLYRINKKEEVYDFGIEEYLSGGSYCFMEWPEIIDDMLPNGTVRVRITVAEDGERILNID